VLLYSEEWVETGRHFTHFISSRSPGLLLCSLLVLIPQHPVLKHPQSMLFLHDRKSKNAQLGHAYSHFYGFREEMGRQEILSRVPSLEFNLILISS
jgi:hypothetical protein